MKEKRRKDIDKCMKKIVRLKEILSKEPFR